MKITKRQLKRIIKEEYSKLRRQGLIRESMHKKNHFGVEDAYMPMGPGSYYDDEHMGDMKDHHAGKEKTIIDLAADGGIHIDELVEMHGEGVFAKIDKLEEAGLIMMLDDGIIISTRGY